MRIALVARELHRLNGGGIGVQVAGAAEALADVAEVTVVTSSANEAKYRERLKTGSSPLRDDVRIAFAEEPVPGQYGSWYGSMHLYAARVQETLRELYGDRGPDLIEFPDFLGEGLVTVQARRAHDPFWDGTAVCVRTHTSAEMCSILNGHLPDDFETRVVFAGERHALRFADRIVTPGGDVLDTYRRFYGLHSLAPAATIRCLIPMSARAVSEPPPFDDGVRFLYMGRLERRKGVQDLIRAATGLRQDEWTLTLLGGDTDSAPLRTSMREQLELSAAGDPRIRFLDGLPRDAVAELIDSHHVVVVPSRWECWPSVILEALGANRPVLATPTGGMVEMASVPGAGWLADDTGAEAIAEAMEHLLNEPSKIQALINDGAPARAHAQLTDRDSFRTAYTELAQSVQAGSAGNGRYRAGPRRSPALVSVVIPYFNLDGFIEDTVRSVFEQDHEQLEVLLVNDGSLRPEDTILRELATRYPLQVVTQQNSGLGRSRNSGIALSRGRYVLPLDADNLIRPNFVSRCLEILEDEEDVAFVATWSRYIDEHGHEHEGLGSGYQPIGNTTEFVHQNNVAGDATALIRRRVFDLGHWYSTDLTSYEDWQFYRELHDAGLYGRVIPERLLLYRVRQGSMIREVGLPHQDRLYGEMGALLRERQMEWVCRSDSASRQRLRTR
jgi:glycogen(starch) synthase